MEIRFPIFVRAKDCGDMKEYASVSDMQYDVEKIDIENAEYEGWDSSGVPLAFSLQTPIWLRIEARQETPQPEALGAAIEAYAASAGIQGERAMLSRGDFSSALRIINSRAAKRHGTTNFWDWFLRRKR